MARLWIYVATRHPEPLTVPFHRCDAVLEVPGLVERQPMAYLRLAPPYRSGFARDRTALLDSVTIEGTSHEVVLRGPGMLLLTAELFTYGFHHPDRMPEAHFEVRLAPVGAGGAASLGARLQPAVSPEKGFIAAWMRDAD